jgi:CheY-like chemotaxis protein
MPMMVAPQAVTEDDPTVPFESAALFGRRILLAEDNKTNQKIALALLKKMGCETTLAENGVDVLSQLADNSNFDIILMDCQMPQLDGYETARQLRINGCRIPIIALTAGAMIDERKMCFAAGMDDYLSKPFRPKELEQILCSWIGKKSPFTSDSEKL